MKLQKFYAFAILTCLNSVNGTNFFSYIFLAHEINTLRLFLKHSRKNGNSGFAELDGSTLSSRLEKMRLASSRKRRHYCSVLQIFPRSYN